MTTLTINLDTLSAESARRISSFILKTAGVEYVDAAPLGSPSNVDVATIAAYEADDEARAVEARPRPPKVPEGVAFAGGGGLDGNERRTMVETPPDDVTPDRDMRGVPFDAAMCARAAAPFYGSGPNEGQWKKKVGVDKSKYDAWYAAELAKLPTQADAEPAAFNMGAMFQPTPTPAAAPSVTTAGEFMRWVSESTVAGTLTQAQVDAAWSALGLGYADIMPPTPPEQIAENVQALMGELQ
jgi:hypothetical protein